MHQNQHVEMMIEKLSEKINDLCIKYQVPTDIPVEKCLSTFSIKDMILSDEYSIYDQLDSIYKKKLKSLFNDLKKINFLGNPRLSYYKDNTIKISSNIIDILWFKGNIDSISFIIKEYLEKLKSYLKSLKFIKYIQYVLDIPGLKLEVGSQKLTIEEQGIIIQFPFEEGEINNLVNDIKLQLKGKKMDVMSSVLLLRQTNNELYIPQKYDDYYIPDIFQPCLNNFYINSINQGKYVKVFYEGRFVKVYYLSAYEFMNNKINKPFCYFYIENNKLLDTDNQSKINKILKLQDSLE